MPTGSRRRGRSLLRESEEDAGRWKADLDEPHHVVVEVLHEGDAKGDDRHLELTAEVQLIGREQPREDRADRVGDVRSDEREGFVVDVQRGFSDQLQVYVGADASNGLEREQVCLTPSAVV